MDDREWGPEFEPLKFQTAPRVQFDEATETALRLAIDARIYGYSVIDEHGRRIDPRRLRRGPWTA